MKRTLCLILITAAVCLLSGCKGPDSYQMDLSQGYGQNLKLIHLNASSQEKRERMEAFRAAIENAQPLEKDFSLFAYYPDYKLELAFPEDADVFTVIVDINGDFVDFYYPGPYPEQSETIYRSTLAADDFKKLVHQA